MNKIIFEQLNKCKVAKLPPFDENTTHLFIDRIGAKDGKPIKTNHFYVIEIDDYLLSKEHSAVLHQNWNKNIFPASKCYKCECVKIMGDMVKIEGVGYDLKNNHSDGTSWSGWLPLKGIRIVEEI